MTSHVSHSSVTLQRGKPTQRPIRGKDLTGGRGDTGAESSAARQPGWVVCQWGVAVCRRDSARDLSLQSLELRSVLPLCRPRKLPPPTIPTLPPNCGALEISLIYPV